MVKRQLLPPLSLLGIGREAASGRPQLFMSKINVYIDSFNLYYGCLKGTPYKWLDVGKLSSLLIPKAFQINRIRFFTARVTGVTDPDAPTRQDIYLRAVRTLPNLSIVYGHFLTTKVMMPFAKRPARGPKFARVIKTEEKGSDVNLASYLLLDAFDKDCDAALVVSNDSDLLEPIRIAKRNFRMTVGLACPHRNPAAVLAKEVGFIRPIRGGMLQGSQFPHTLTDTSGQFSKPPSW